MENIYYKVADRPQKQIEAFKNRYDYVSQDDIISIFKDRGFEVESIKKSESWWTGHLIYYIKIKWQEKELVFRSNSWVLLWFEDREIIMFWEKIITDLVSRIWVRTNKILEVDISREKYQFDYQIEEKLIWVDPERYIDENWKFLDSKEKYDQLSFELWQAIAKYSNLKFVWYWLLDEEELLKWNIVWLNETFYDYITTNLIFHLDFLLEKEIINKKEYEFIISIFEKFRDTINDCESSLVHHDLADHNITYDIKKWWLWEIFDWEAMVLWDSMLDLWSCPTWNTHFERKEKLIEWYSSIKALPSDYELRMNLYNLRTRIWKAKFLIQMDYWEESASNQIEALKKLLKYFHNL